VKTDWWEYLFAAIVGAAIFTLIVTWISNSNDLARERDCDLMGVTMFKGKPYKCSRIVPVKNEGTTESADDKD
jgi:hypothetical protein